MSRPKFLRNPSRYNDVVNQEKEGLGKKSLLGYTVKNQNDRRNQEAINKELICQERYTTTGRIGRYRRGISVYYKRTDVERLAQELSEYQPEDGQHDQ